MPILVPPQKKIATPPAGYEWKHLWRCLNSTTVVADDGTDGGCPLTMAAVNQDSDGITTTSTSSRLENSDYTNLWADLRDLGDPMLEYMIVMDLTTQSGGWYTGSNFGRFYDFAVDTRPPSTYWRTASNSIAIRYNCAVINAIQDSSVSVELYTFPNRTVWFWARWNDGGTKRTTIYAYQSGVQVWTQNAPYTALTTCGTSGVFMVLNRVDRVRAYHGTLHWAGILEGAYSDADRAAIATAGRPST
jgi:hypothetical protein